MSDIDSTDPENAWYEDSGRAATHRQRAAMYEQAIENGELDTELNQAEVDALENSIVERLIEVRRARIAAIEAEIADMYDKYPMILESGE